MLQIGFDRHNLYNQPTSWSTDYDLMDAVVRVSNNSTQVDVNMIQNGLMISMNKWWTNVVSFVKLATPVVKGDDDIMYVSYGYKVV